MADYCDAVSPVNLAEAYAAHTIFNQLPPAEDVDQIHHHRGYHVLVLPGQWGHPRHDEPAFLCKCMCQCRALQKHAEEMMNLRILRAVENMVKAEMAANGQLDAPSPNMLERAFTLAWAATAIFFLAIALHTTEAPEVIGRGVRASPEFMTRIINKLRNRAGRRRASSLPNEDVQETEEGISSA